MNTKVNSILIEKSKFECQMNSNLNRSFSKFNKIKRNSESNRQRTRSQSNNDQKCLTISNDSDYWKNISENIILLISAFLARIKANMQNRANKRHHLSHFRKRKNNLGSQNVNIGKNNLGSQYVNSAIDIFGKVRSKKIKTVNVNVWNIFCKQIQIYKKIIIKRNMTLQKTLIGILFNEVDTLL
jgi:hypothetical protein